MSLPDLVRAKRTQQDTDWPMVARLLEAHYFQNKNDASPQMVDFWLGEMHDWELLQQIASEFPAVAEAISQHRPAIRALRDGNMDDAQRRLQQEIDDEKRADREYWEPLKRELAALRHR